MISRPSEVRPMKKTSLLVAILMAVFYITGGNYSASAQNKEDNVMASNNPKILVAYFSHSGNTKNVAQQIQSLVGGDIFEISTVQGYPSEYRATTEVARKELDGNFRPQLSGQVADMASYDLIFLGYPNWWSTMPTALFTFLEQYDFSGKSIAPFCTHEGSRLGRSLDDLGRLAPGARITKGFEIRGSRVAGAGESLSAWIKEIGLAP